MESLRLPTRMKDVSGLFIRLKNLTTSEVHTLWDTAFLDRYIQGTMVPCSLGWDVCPLKGETDLDAWFKYFNETGVKFLDFLVQRKRDKLVHLDEEIRKVKEKLSPYKRK